MNHLGRFGAGALGLLLLLSWGSPVLGQDADLQKKINIAVDKGVEFLKGAQTKEGHWDFNGPYRTGVTALAALSLLDCGVSKDDKVVQQAADYVRQTALGETKNYNLSLMVFFLDHLDDPADIPLLQVLGLRLLSSQLQCGGWSYDATTEPITAAEKGRVSALVEARKKALAAKLPAALSKQMTPALVREAQLYAFRPLGHMKAGSNGDNSNTQFAMLALWVARRYGVPTERALALVEARFRSSQWPNGTWNYESFGPGNPPGSHQYWSNGMNCAGLLGLALGHANDKTRAVNKIITQDPQVRLAFTRLSKVLDGTVNELPAPQKPSKEGEEARRYYFLWSLERVAVVFDLKKIGPTDWYVWGAKRIVDEQSAQGAWTAEFGPIADTSFVLLFLKKANVVADLTSDLRKTPKTKTSGRLPDDLLDLLPVEDPTKKPGPKKTPEKSKQSSSLPPPALLPDGSRFSPIVTSLAWLPIRGESLYRREGRQLLQG